MAITIETAAMRHPEWIGIVRKALLSVGQEMSDDRIEFLWAIYSDRVWYTDFLEPTYNDLREFLYWGGWTEEQLDYKWCVENADWFD